MIRIGYVLGQFPSLSETFVLREIDALMRLGCEAIVLALSPGKEEKAHEQASGMCGGGLIVHSGAGGYSKMCSALFWLWKRPMQSLRLMIGLLGWLIRDPVWGLRVLRQYPLAAAYARRVIDLGVVHLHAHFAFLPSDVARMISELTGISFSVSAHAWDIYAQKKSRVVRALEDARFVAVCSVQARDHLVDLLPERDGSKVVLIHHGLDVSRFRMGDSSSGMILGVGRLVGKKGFDVLLEACGILREKGIPFRCVIAGDGPCRHQLEKSILRLGLSDAATLIGAVTQDELIPLIENAGVFVLPSIMTSDGDRDGIPNAVLEAQAGGLPVVSTTASAASEVITDGENGFLVPPGDAQALAEKIEQLLSNSDFRRLLGRRGRERVGKNFDAVRNTEKLRMLFEEVVSGK